MKNHENEPIQDNQTDGYYDKKPNFTSNRPSGLRQLWNQSKVYFLVLAAGILFYFILLRLSSLSGILTQLITVLKPVIYGVVIAYILNRPVNFCEKYFARVLIKWTKNEKKAGKAARGLGILVSMAFILFLFIGLCNLILPELYRSIMNLVLTLPQQLEDILTKINSMNIADTTVDLMIKNIFTEATTYIQNWLKTDLLSQLETIMSGLTEGVVGMIGMVFDLMIGMIIAVYLLFSTKTFASQGKKVLYAFIKPKYANMTLHLTRKSNEIFGGYIAGVMTDAAFVGVLCFIGMWFLKMPYAVLISVVIGTTNIIPYFGPYIGAIPSVILILLNDPRQGIYFIIFILVLQQIDGNIIAPKILGDSTGLSSFWVIVATLLGGGIFGLVGMVMGVPAFGVIYYVVQTIINQKLEKKNLPAHSKNYDENSYVDNAGIYMKKAEENSDVQ